jgi:hypothetical protein
LTQQIIVWGDKDPGIFVAQPVRFIDKFSRSDYGVVGKKLSDPDIGRCVVVVEVLHIVPKHKVFWL